MAGNGLSGSVCVGHFGSASGDELDPARQEGSLGGRRSRGGGQRHLPARPISSQANAQWES